MSLEAVHAHTTAVRDALETMLLGVDARGAREDVLAALRTAVGALAGAAALDPDHPDAIMHIDRATTATGELRAAYLGWRPPADDDQAAGDIEIIDEAIDVLQRVRAILADRFVAAAGVRFDDADGTVPFTASTGAPSLFEGVEVPPPNLIPVDERWAAFDDPSRDKRARTDRTNLQGEIALLDGLSRDLMEDLATLGSLRRMTDVDVWGASEPFEERLLASLDALMSLARPVRAEAPRLDLVERLYRYAIEWWVPDLGRSFAFAFTLSCLRSETAMRWLVLGAHRAPEPTHEAFAAALALGSSPDVPSAVTALLTSDHVALVKLGLEAARRTRFFQLALQLPLVAHPDVDVAEAALRTFVHAPKATAFEVATEVLVTGTSRSSDRRIVYLAAVAAELLATYGHPPAVPAARDLLEGALREGDARTGTVALRVVALNGDRRDAELVQRAALALPGGLVLLGFFGAPEHSLAVVEQLRNPDLVDDATRALRRLTGFDFEPPYDVDALHARVAGKLKEWSGRTRFGAPHSAAVVRRELLEGTTLQRERRILAVEAGMLAREPLTVDLDGWVSRQHAELGMFFDATK